MEIQGPFEISMLDATVQHALKDEKTTAYAVWLEDIAGYMHYLANTSPDTAKVTIRGRQEQFAALAGTLETGIKALGQDSQGLSLNQRYAIACLFIEASHRGGSPWVSAEQWTMIHDMLAHGGQNCTTLMESLIERVYRRLQVRGTTPAPKH